jgi:hypothetical protein
MRTTVFAFLTLLSLLLVLVSISCTLQYYSVFLHASNSFSQTFKFKRTQVKSGIEIILCEINIINLWVLGMQVAGRDVVAREELGGYWKKAMDNQPMPEAIEGRTHPQTGKGRVYFDKNFDSAAPMPYILWGRRRRPPPGDRIHPISKAKPWLALIRINVHVLGFIQTKNVHVLGSE